MESNTLKEQKGEDVVVLKSSLEETLYLLSSEKNRTHLLESIKQVKKV